MKNLLNKIILFFVFVSCTAFSLTAKDIALVVRQDGQKVYLDTSELDDGAKVGDAFRIVNLGEDIINPKTGKSLGKTAEKQITGRLIKVEPLYSIGQLDTNENVMGRDAEIKITQNIDLLHTAFPITQNAPDNELKIMPAWQSKPLEGTAKAAAAGDLSGDKNNELVLAFEKNNTIKVFSLEDNTLKEVSSAQVNPLRKIIALDSADLKGTGQSQVFASVYDTTAERFLTLVFELQAGKLNQTDSFGGVTKGIAPQNKTRVLYTQDIVFAGGQAAATVPAELIYKNASFTKGSRLKAHKFDSVFGFNMSDFWHDGKNKLIYTLPTHRLRIQFDRIEKYIESPDDIEFGLTPNKIKYKGQTMSFYISLGLFKNTNGDTLIAAVENRVKQSFNSEAFDSFGEARLYMLRWTGTSLIKAALADIPGTVYDIIQAPLGNYKNILIVPFSAPTGTTTVLIIPQGNYLPSV